MLLYFWGHINVSKLSWNEIECECKCSSCSSITSYGDKALLKWLKAMEWLQWKLRMLSPHCIPPLSSQPCWQRTGWTPSPRPLFSVRIQDLTISAQAAFPVIVEMVIYCSHYQLSEWGGWGNDQQRYHRCLVNTKDSLTSAVMGNILTLPSLTFFGIPTDYHSGFDCLCGYLGSFSVCL